MATTETLIHQATFLPPRNSDEDFWSMFELPEAHREGVINEFLDGLGAIKLLASDAGDEVATDDILEMCDHIVEVYVEQHPPHYRVGRPEILATALHDIRVARAFGEGIPIHIVELFQKAIDSAQCDIAYMEEEEGVGSNKHEGEKIKLEHAREALLAHNRRLQQSLPQ